MKKRKVIRGLLLGVFMTAAVLVLVVGWMAGRESFGEVSTVEAVSVESGEVIEAYDEEDLSAVETPEKTEVKVDFQEIIDEWVRRTSGNKSVLIFDLEREEIAGEYNADEKYNTASLYKLFVAYEGYERVARGEWGGEEKVGTTGKTVLECLDLAIRGSHSPCAEALWAKIGHVTLDGIVRDEYKITNSEISSLVSNARDIAKMMEIFYRHEEITDEGLVAQIKDSFLNQPTTTYNWRQGLPSGFARAAVYNKVGWDYNAEKKYWNIYHDAAIVEFPKKTQEGTSNEASMAGRHFIVVVMTNRVSFQQIRQLGASIEEAFYAATESVGAEEL